jgi:protein-S-isoprenylcysteine O-methyltransferase Ste14
MSSDLPFRIIQGLIFITFVANRAYYNRKYPPLEDETLDKHEQGKSTRRANLLSLVAMAALTIYLINPRWMSWASIPLSDPLRWSGVIIAMGGFALLQWSQASLGKNWSDQPRIIQGQTLVVDGPYRWIPASNLKCLHNDLRIQPVNYRQLVYRWAVDCGHSHRYSSENQI